MTASRALTDTATQKKEVAHISGGGAFVFTPRNLQEAKEYAALVANSGLCPAQYKGKPDDVLIAWQYGAEIGVKPMQSLQGIAVINGRPCVWGDLMLAVVQDSNLMEWHNEYFSEDGKIATFEGKRKGNPHTIKYSFSVDDAKTAGLWGKAGPWTTAPRRMLQMRARGFALRNGWSDVLKGFVSAEEAQDYDVVATVDNTTEVVKPRRKSEVEAVIAENAKTTETATTATTVTQPGAEEIGTADIKEFIPTKVMKDKEGTIKIYRDIGEPYLTKNEGFGAIAKAAIGKEFVSLSYMVEANGSWVQNLSLKAKA